MNNRKDKWIWLLFFGAISAYVGYLISGMFDPDSPLKAEGAIERINYRIQHPFGFWWNKYSIWCIGIALLIFILGYLLYYDPRKEKMRVGKEYGSASFGDPKIINSNMEDKSCEFNNKIFSNLLRIATNIDKLSQKYKINNNAVIIGGAGSGKTRFIAKPNVMQMPDNTSFICTDPDGGLLRDTGHLMRDHGYNIRVLNLIEFNKSDHFNPFMYIRTEKDIDIFTQNLIDNTTPVDAHKGDPFWENAEKLLLKSLFFYIYYEEPLERKNFRTVMELLGKADIPEKGKASEYDKLINKLREIEAPNGKIHPAVRFYDDCMVGAEDTKRSIVISAKARLNVFYNDELLDLLSYDDLRLSEIGTGVNNDKKTKTILYCIIPDSMDTTYNFIVGIMYTLLFQELYYQADIVHGGRLPINVTIIMDEFANTALPRNTPSIFATCRKRGIGLWAILQNLSQLKKLFKDDWESLVGNCDTFIYLGGNEQASHKYVSEKLGTETIYKRHDSVNVGKNGGGSKSMDVLGRKIMTEDEVGQMENDKSLIFIKGQKPIFDYKYKLEKHPRFKELKQEDTNIFTFIPRSRGVEVLDESSVKFYENQGEIVDIDSDVLMYQFALGLVEEKSATLSTVESKNKTDPGEAETKVNKGTKETELTQEAVKTDEITKNRKPPVKASHIVNRVLSDIHACERESSDIKDSLDKLEAFIDTENFTLKYQEIRVQLERFRKTVNETNAETTYKSVEAIAKTIQELKNIVFAEENKHIKE